MSGSSSRPKHKQNSDLKKEIEDLKRALQKKDSENSELRRQLEQNKVKLASLEKSLAETRQELVTLKTEIQEIDGTHALVLDLHHTHPDAPTELQTASSALVGDIIYFKILRTRIVFEYNSATKKWSELPLHPLDAFTIVCVDGALVTVGGGEMLYTLIDKQWKVYEVQSLPTVRYVPAVVYCNHTLMVAGGIKELTNPVDKVKTVEVLNTQTKQWSTVSSLRVGAHQTSAVKCGGYVFISTKYDPYYCIQKCAWEELLKSSPTSSVWDSMQLPACKATLQVLNGTVLAIGGQVKKESTKAIYWYRELVDRWVKIGDMSIPRDECQSAVLPDNTLIVVGSQSKPCEKSRTKVDCLKLEINSIKARTNTL